MDALATPDAFLFEGFRLDRRGLSRRDDNGGFVPVPIGSRALEVLGVLVERAGDLVSKDEIMNAVWPGDCRREQQPAGADRGASPGTRQ